MVINFTSNLLKSVSSKVLPLALLLASMLLTNGLKAQTTTYPRVAGYFCISNSIGSWNKDGFTSNFGDSYSVSFPMGINILKSDHFGVSFEVCPVIQTVNNISKVSSVVINPGAIFRFKNGFNIFTRVSFETNGRFGFGPTFSKVLIKGKNASLFGSIPVPVRFGNNLPASVSTGVILGVLF